MLTPEQSEWVANQHELVLEIVASLPRKFARVLGADEVLGVALLNVASAARMYDPVVNTPRVYLSACVYRAVHDAYRKARNRDGVVSYRGRVPESGYEPATDDVTDMTSALPDREREIVTRVASGETRAGIAKSLGMCARSIDRIYRAAIKKLKESLS